jgi:hypothetical protein
MCVRFNCILCEGVSAFVGKSMKGGIGSKDLLASLSPSTRDEGAEACTTPDPSVCNVRFLYGFGLLAEFASLPTSPVVEGPIDTIRRVSSPVKGGGHIVLCTRRESLGMKALSKDLPYAPMCNVLFRCHGIAVSFGDPNQGPRYEATGTPVAPWHATM